MPHKFAGFDYRTAVVLGRGAPRLQMSVSFESTRALCGTQLAF